jgi:hypothetical protein
VAKIWLGCFALDLMLDEYIIELLSPLTLT